MSVALIALDKLCHIGVGKDNRMDHIKFLKSGIKVSQAGPRLSDEREMIGSLIILDVNSVEDAKLWLENHPYVKAGVLESVELIAWNKMI